MRNGLHEIVRSDEGQECMLVRVWLSSRPTLRSGPIFFPEDEGVEVGFLERRLTDSAVHRSAGDSERTESTSFGGAPNVC